MSESLPASLTIEEAIARMLNVDYVPPGFTLFELLGAFREEAECDRDNARIERTPDAQLQRRLDVCVDRCHMAELLFEDLRRELANNPNTPLSSSESSCLGRVDLAALNDWSSDRYGISITASTPQPGTAHEIPPGTTWLDVRIKIQANHRIAYSIKEGSWRTTHFSDIGLLGKNHNTPNKPGQILIQLAEEVGQSRNPSTAKLVIDAKSVCLLRRALVKLTGLKTGDPIKCETGRVYVPSFTLIDDRRNADVRAKGRARHVPLTEQSTDPGNDEMGGDTPDFEDENDDAGEFLKGLTITGKEDK